MKQFFEIRKVDEEARMVWGYASTEAVDAQGEIITKLAMETAWDDYMKFGNIREMHQPSAVGVVKEYAFDDTGIQIGAYVVDDTAWKKVQAGVYKGFSVGGKKLPGGYDLINKTITALKITEISLVDRPANPEALITVWKADGMETEMDEEVKTNAPVIAAADIVAGMVAKGELTREQLLALAGPAPEAEVAKVDVPAPKAAIQKSLQLLTAAPGTDDVKKGMCGVSHLSDLVQSLVYLQQDCAWEAEYEKDNSPLPVQLAAAASNLASLLVAMAQEEAAELVATLKLPEGTDPVTAMSTIIANSESGKDYQKFADALDVMKTGARNSATDATRIQKAHDLLAELGAACGQSETEKVAKVDDHAGHNHDDTDIAKALQSFEKVAGELNTLRKSFDSLQTEHETLKKAWADTPTAPKGALTVVAKGEDLSDAQVEADKVEPVRKQDGSVDEAATAIKKIHAGGGRPMIRP